MYYIYDMVSHQGGLIRVVSSGRSFSVVSNLGGLS